MNRSELPSGAGQPVGLAVLLGVLCLAGPLPGACAGEGDKAVRLSVGPMAVPRPALKYQLLPEVRELKPGNPVQWYIRCFAEQRNFFFNKEANEERLRYLSMPLTELPADRLRTYGGSALTQADYAARLDTPDWQMLDRVQAEGGELRLPELGPLRILGVALQVRFRGAVAGRRFDDAVVTAKTMFALARHLQEHPTPGGNALGQDIASMALETLEEMVQQPGCPNLYWALGDLPSPLVGLRKGFQGECALAAAQLRSLREDAPMTEAQIEELVSHLSGRLGFARAEAGAAPPGFRAALRARVKDSERVRAARERLVPARQARGLGEKFPPAQIFFAGSARALVWKFPPAQVILLDEKAAYEVQRDEQMKLLALAPYQREDLARNAKAGRPAEGLFADFLPHVAAACRKQGRLEQRIALLRHVDALRLYAAGHEGKLPARLADISVPLPPDPLTNKPFSYELEGDTAHVRGSPSRGEEKNSAFNLHYVVTVRK